MNGNSSPARKESSKRSYKLWVLLAVLVLALWSMVTGSVTLRWSAVGNLSRFSDALTSPNYDDLDILEVEEREKVVRHMWDLYGRSKSGKLPRFWREAFEAAYENLVSDVPGITDFAFSEIAKMSVFSVALDPLPLKSQETRDQSRKMANHIEKKKEATKPPKKEKKDGVNKVKTPKIDADQVKSDD